MSKYIYIYFSRVGKVCERVPCSSLVCTGVNYWCKRLSVGYGLLLLDIVNFIQELVLIDNTFTDLFHQ